VKGTNRLTGNPNLLEALGLKNKKCINVKSVTPKPNS